MHWHPQWRTYVESWDGQMHLPGVLSKQKCSSIFFLSPKELGVSERQKKCSLLSTSQSVPVQASACLEMWRSTPFAVLNARSLVMEAAFTLVLLQETQYCLSAACGARWLDSARPRSPSTSNQSSFPRFNADVGGAAACLLVCRSVTQSSWYNFCPAPQTQVDVCTHRWSVLGKLYARVLCSFVLFLTH